MRDRRNKGKKQRTEEGGEGVRWENERGRKEKLREEKEEKTD